MRPASFAVVVVGHGTSDYGCKRDAVLFEGCALTAEAEAPVVLASAGWNNANPTTRSRLAMSYVRDVLLAYDKPLDAADPTFGVGKHPRFTPPEAHPSARDRVTVTLWIRNRGGPAPTSFSQLQFVFGADGSVEPPKAVAFFRVID